MQLTLIGTLVTRLSGEAEDQAGADARTPLTSAPASQVRAGAHYSAPQWHPVPASQEHWAPALPTVTDTIMAQDNNSKE